MDRRDEELLAKQLRVVMPPRSDGLVGLAVVTVFLVGIAVGSLLFADDSQHAQSAPAVMAMFLSDSTPQPIAQ